MNVILTTCNGNIIIYREMYVLFYDNIIIYREMYVLFIF